MELLELPNFGLQGANPDFPPWKLDETHLTRAQNVRVEDGWLQAVDGYEVYTTFPYAGAPVFLMPVQTPTDYFWVVCSESIFGVFDGTTWFDLTPVGYAPVSGTDRWYGFVHGTVPVVGNPEGYPQYWGPVSSAQVFQGLPYNATETWEEKGYKAVKMIAHKGFHIALGVDKNTGEPLRDLVKWSDVAPPGALPSTWEEGDLTALAGETDIPDNGGHIIDGIPLLDDVIIFKESSLWRMQWLGDSTYVWKLSRITGTVGAIAPDSIVEVQGRIYFIADGDILVTDGFKTESIIEDRFVSTFAPFINPDLYQKSYAVKHYDRKEIWFCVPADESAVAYPNTAIIWNWHNNMLSVFTMDEYGMIAFGIRADAVASELWNDGQGYPEVDPPDGVPQLPTPPDDPAWENWGGSWGSRRFNPLNDILLGIEPISKELRILDNGEDIGGHETNIVERIGMPIAGHRTTVTVVSIYPQLTSTQAVQIEVGSQMQTGGPVLWQPAVNYDPNTQDHFDCLVTGVTFCFRMTTNGNPFWKMSGMNIYYEIDGER
jgi:hypothetical protein